MTIAEISPGLTLIIGSLLIPLLPNRLRPVWLVLLPLIGLAHLAQLSPGDFGAIQFLGQQLVTLRVDRWSLAFGWIFMVAALLAAIYAMQVRRPLEPTLGLIYAGSAIGAVFAGDLLTLFVFWELTAIASVFLIWASNRESAYQAGMRYLIVQLVSGMLLFFGALIQWNATGSLAFDHIGLAAPGGWLIFLAFGIKCAFPLLHNWLLDAYPEASAVGTVFLSAFTTKLAVYALARGYAGTEILITIGTIMAVFPLLYAALENDLRRVMTRVLHVQIGFMVVGIGIGTELALNGAVAHAAAGIFYKALLFMALGALLLRVGTVNAGDLGGLYRSMPLTAFFCIVGAATVSGMPLLAGFVSKAMLAAASEVYPLIWGALLFSSVGVVLVAGIRIPYLAFFARDAGKRCAEAPPNMLAAMGLATMLCVVIGVLPGTLGALLPHPLEYSPYTAAKLLAQLQLLAFSGLAFALLVRLLPLPQRMLLLDSDWLYRGGGATAVNVFRRTFAAARAGLTAALHARIIRAALLVTRERRPGGLLLRSWPTGSMSLWVMTMLLAYLVIHYLG